MKKLFIKNYCHSDLPPFSPQGGKSLWNYNFIIVNGIITVRLQFDMINLEKQRAQTKQKGLVKFES